MTYTKYSASGNDFVIFHSFIKKDYSKEAITLCNRTEGIGADGLIVLIPNSDYDFEWLFYNSDGSHAAMCGNGTRACAHYAYINNLAPSNMKFLTGAGAIESIVEDDVVQTQLTKPILIKDEFIQDGFTWYYGKIYVRTYERGVEGETLACGTGMAACFLRANNLGLVEDIANVYPKSKEELTLTKKDEILYFKGAVKKVFTTSIN
jgi:diaminopimelate epimerase